MVGGGAKDSHSGFFILLLRSSNLSPPLDYVGVFKGVALVI